MEKFKLDANEQFYDRMIYYLSEGGIWMWPALQEVFYKQDGKLKAETKRGYDSLKSTVSKKWFDKNIIHNF